VGEAAISYGLPRRSSLQKVPEWKILSAFNAERSLLKARSRCQAVQFARMNGSLFVTLARNGRRSNG
jgi:hypothetical protein